MKLTVLICMKHFVQKKMMTNLAIHMILVHRQKAVHVLRKLLTKPPRVIQNRKRNKKFQRKGRKWKGRAKILLKKRKNIANATIKLLKLVPAIFYWFFLFFHQILALKKLWKMFFISSKKLFSFSRYSNFCNFFPSFPNFPDSKGQIEVE